MMADTAKELATKLADIKEQRKDGALNLAQYYQALLKITARLADSLSDEADSLSDDEIIMQMPLVLLFVEEQISKFASR